MLYKLLLKKNVFLITITIKYFYLEVTHQLIIYYMIFFQVPCNNLKLTLKYTILCLIDESTDV